MNNTKSRLLSYLRQIARLHHQTFAQIAKLNGHAEGYIPQRMSNDKIVRPEDFQRFIPYLSKNDFIQVKLGSNEPFKRLLNIYRDRVVDRDSFLRYLEVLIHNHGITMNQLSKHLHIPRGTIANLAKSNSHPHGVRLCFSIARALDVPPSQLLVPYHIAYKQYRKQNRHRLVREVKDRRSLLLLYQSLCRMEEWTFSKLQLQTGVDVKYVVNYGNVHALIHLLNVLEPYFQFTSSERQELVSKFKSKSFLVIIPHYSDSFRIIHNYLRMVTFLQRESMNVISIRNGHGGSYLLNIFLRHRPFQFVRVEKLIPYVNYRDLRLLSYRNTGPFSTALAKARTNIHNREDFARYIFAICIAHGTSIRQISEEMPHNSTWLKDGLRTSSVKVLKPKLMWVARHLSIKPRVLLSPLNDPHVAHQETTVHWLRYRTKSARKRRNHRWVAELGAQIKGPKSLLRYVNLIVHLHGTTLSKVSIKMGHTDSYMEVAIGRNHAFKAVPRFEKMAKILNVSPTIFLNPLKRMFGSTRGVYDRKSLLRWVNKQAHFHGYYTYELSKAVGKSGSYLSGSILIHKPDSIRHALRLVAPYLLISDWTCDMLTQRINEPSVYHLSYQKKAFNTKLFTYCRILAIADGDNLTNISLQNGHAGDYLANIFLTKLTDNAIDILLVYVPNLTRKAIDLIKIGDDSPLNDVLSKMADNVHDRASFSRYVRCVCLAHGYTLAQISVYYGHERSNGLSQLSKANRYDIKIVCQHVTNFLGLESGVLLKPFRKVKADKSIHLGSNQTDIKRVAHMQRVTKIKAVKLDVMSSVKDIAKQAWMAVPVLSKTLYQDPNWITKTVQHGSIAEIEKMLSYTLKSSGIESLISKKTLTRIRSLRSEK